MAMDTVNNCSLGNLISLCFDMRFECDKYNSSCFTYTTDSEVCGLEGLEWDHIYRKWLISLLILKQFIFFFQRGVANSYQNTGIASEMWSYGPYHINFIQLSSIYCTLNPVNTTRLSFHGRTFFPCGRAFITHCE